MRDSLGAPARAGAASLDKLKGSIEGVDHALKSAHGGAHTFASGVSYAVRGFDDLARGGRYAANGVLDVGKAFSRLGPRSWAPPSWARPWRWHGSHSRRPSSKSRRRASPFRGSAGKDGKKHVRESIDATARAVHMPAEKAHETGARLLMLRAREPEHALSDGCGRQRRCNASGSTRAPTKSSTIIDRSLATGHFALGKGGAGALARHRARISEGDSQRSLGTFAEALESQMRAGASRSRKASRRSTTRSCKARSARSPPRNSRSRTPSRT